jgi:hypothetical protein
MRELKKDEICELPNIVAFTDVFSVGVVESEVGYNLGDTGDLSVGLPAWACSGEFSSLQELEDALVAVWRCLRVDDPESILED